MQPGAFGGDASECWQLRNRDAGEPRRYDQYLVTPTGDITDPPSGCWFRALNQPMRLAALAKALVADGPYDETTVVLCAPAENRNVWRQWRTARRVLHGRFEDLNPGEVADLLPVPVANFLLDAYGINPTHQTDDGDVGDEATAWVPARWLREVLGWGLIAELVRRHPRAFRLLETHPGGGLYDCLSLYTAEWEHIISLNRVGSLHFFQPDEAWQYIWELLAAEDTDVDAAAVAVAERAGLDQLRSDRLPDITTAVSFMTDVATATARSGWQWRQGFHDTTGYGGGIMDAWFAALPEIPGPDRGKDPDDHARRYWFLVKGWDRSPIAAVDELGVGWIEHKAFDLTDPADRARCLALTLQAARP